MSAKDATPEQVKELKRLKNTKVPLTLRATTRFVRDYRRASFAMRNAARHKVRGMQAKAAAQKTWMKSYKSMQGVRKSIPGQVIELKIGAGDRLLVQVKGSVATLVGLGDHDVTDEIVKKRNLKRELEDAVEAPAGFRAQTLLELIIADAGLVARGDKGLFGPEVQPEWLMALSDEQLDAWTAVVEEVDAVLDGDGGEDTAVIFIEGGPGTGKTSVLLNLFDHFREEGREVALHMADHLQAFIQTQTTLDIASAVERANDAHDAADIALVDDPASLGDLRWGANRANVNARTTGRAVVIVAFDPLQVEGTRGDELSDEVLEDIRSKYEATRIVLRDCYRQRADVGIAARNITGVILQSSPFLADGKKAQWADGRRTIAQDALDLRFINTAGSVYGYEDATWDDWKTYVRYVMDTSLAQRFEGDPGEWPAFAVVEPIAAELPDTWSDLLRTVPHHRVGGAFWADELRGIEYQHVAVLLTQSELEMVTNGFTGSGRADYEKFRLLRIPFSRARESLAVFALA